jgi:hypothetical protein
MRRSSPGALASAAVVKYRTIAVHHPVREPVRLGTTAAVANMTSWVVIRTGADCSVVGTGASTSILAPAPTTSPCAAFGAKTNSDIGFSPIRAGHLHPADMRERILTTPNIHA